MLVKCSFGDDIRRFTIDHPFTAFSGLEHQLATLYKIPKGNFKIFYTDNEGDKIAISTNEELSAAVIQATGPNILRLTLVENFESQKANTEELPFKFANDDFKEPPSNSPFSIPVSLKEMLENGKTYFSNSTETSTQFSSTHASTNTSSPPFISSSTNTNAINITNIGTNTKKSDSISTSTATINTFSDDLDMDELFSNPKFQDRLATILSHAIATRTFSQLLQNMIPQMTDILKESIRATSIRSTKSEDSMIINDEEIEDIPPNVSLNSLIASDSSSSSSSDSSFEVDLPEINEATELEEEEMPAEPEEEPQFLPIEPEPIESLPEPVESLSEAAPEEEPVVDQEESTEVDEPEQFVIVSKSPEKNSSPILNSFLSLFKPNQKKTPPKPQEVEIDDAPIPNLDELLSQLESMGFTDKEQNIKVLRFHRKFNEGMDEVIEELLSQKC